MFGKTLRYRFHGCRVFSKGCGRFGNRRNRRRGGRNAPGRGERFGPHHRRNKHDFSDSESEGPERKQDFGKSEGPERFGGG